MTTARVRLQDCADKPWANGGGTLRDLLLWPAGADAQLRVSVARIGRSGPFSHLAGQQRCFALLAGDGVTLALPAGLQTVTPSDGAVAFDGADAPMCTLLGGESLALNLMVRQGAGRPTLARAQPRQPLQGRWRGVYAAGVLPVDVGTGVEVLDAGTLLWTDDAGTPTWRLGAGPGWCLSLE